jgi:polysaccharide biosynthesis protein PslA
VLTAVSFQFKCDAAFSHKVFRVALVNNGQALFKEKGFAACEAPIAANENSPLRQESGSQSWELAAKRGVDISISLIALIILLPLLLLIAAAIRLESRGSVLFTQTRWGMGGQKIKVYKLRSMYADRGDATGIAQTLADDPRVTRVGKFIRRSNIDELPQLLNVLKGDMSLVGPRCHAVGMLAAGVPYEELVPSYHGRHAVRPGLTGLAQMRGLRGPTTRASKARARIASDLYYVENFSIWLDFYIMVETLRREIRGGNGF